MTTLNPRIWNRKLHRWGAIAVALPFFIVLCTGLLLQLKKQIAWVQPPEQKTSVRVPTVTMEQILATAQSVPEALLAWVKQWSGQWGSQCGTLYNLPRD